MRPIVLSVMLFVSMVAVVVGCTSTLEFTETIDPYTKEYSWSYEYIDARPCDPGKMSSWTTRIGFHGTDDLALIAVHWDSSLWAFIDPELGLDMLIDGEVKKLPGYGSPYRDERGGYGSKRLNAFAGPGLIYERVDFLITKDIVQKMRNATRVQFRVRGSKQDIERCLFSKELVHLKEVLPLIDR